MIPIIKNQEPKVLLEFRLKTWNSYEGMPTEIKEKIKRNLLEEQGGLCAYCMCRINEARGHKSTIEHCKPRTICTREEELDYRNMVAVCYGNRDAHNNKYKTCDAKRGTLPVRNQMLKINLFDPTTLESIRYRSDGEIYSDDTEVNKDLNERLNLNCEARQLKDCRKRALQELQQQLYIKYKGQTIPSAKFRALLEHYEKAMPKKEYCGIMIAWLRTTV